MPDADEQRLVVHMPDDESTSAALDRLTGRQPRALRAVAGRHPTAAAACRSAQRTTPQGPAPGRHT
jgi:hypothetical protein